MESKESKQSKKRRQHTKEFRAGAVRLVLEERKAIADVARDLDIHRSLLSYWVRQAKIDAGKGSSGALTTAERQELSELRKRVRVLEMERAAGRPTAVLGCTRN